MGLLCHTKIYVPLGLQPSGTFYIIIMCRFVFVVCLLQTIFGNKRGTHMLIDGKKHGNRDTELNMVCTQWQLLWLLWLAHAI